MMKKGWVYLIGAMLWALCSGCVQAQANSDKREAAQLLIGRGIHGVTMQWKGEQGITYTLFYKDTVGQETSWKPVPGYERITGTGEIIVYKDTAPTAKSRKYRVHTVMPTPGS